MKITNSETKEKRKQKKERAKATAAQLTHAGWWCAEINYRYSSGRIRRKGQTRYRSRTDER